MAIAKMPDIGLLTYERYMGEHLEGRCNIVEGVLIPMPGANWKHQKISFRLAKMMDHHAEATGTGEVITAPFDVLIRRVPRLQTRQPDILYISREQMERGGGIPERGPLTVAPELVVEIISDSETRQIVESKMQDYTEIGVLEMWRVWPDTRAIEVLRLALDGPVTAATYDETQTVQSLTFADLQVPVAAIFGV